MMPCRSMPCPDVYVRNELRRAAVQVNTPARIFLVSTAFLYVGLIVILPFVNIFIQVRQVSEFWCYLYELHTERQLN